MYSNGKHLDELDAGTLEQWKHDKIEESRTIDFKRDPPVLDTNSPKPKIDFLADICGFANAGGGLILLGVSEEREPDPSGHQQHRSRFGEIVGTSVSGGFARYQQQADDIVRAAIEPPGIAFRMREIATADPAKTVLAIGVDRSTRSPHRLCAHGSADFYIRRMRSVDPMGVEEIREAFRRTFTVLQEAEQRLVEAEGRAASISLGSPFFWAAITPTFPAPFQYPPRDRRLHELLGQLGRTRLHLPSHSIGYDVHGAFLFTGGSGGRGVPLFRIHRDGSLERVERLNRGSIKRELRALGNENVITTAVFVDSSHLAQVIARTYKDFEEVRAVLGITGPSLLTAGVCEVNGYELDPLVLYGGRSLEKALPAQQQAAVFLRPRLETSDETLRRIFKNVADFFWNSWGYVECNGFDEDGLPTPVLKSWPMQ